MEKAFVTTAVGRLAYVQAGRGAPILLIHGIPTSSFLWRNVIPPLAEAFTVYAVDLLGYGDSDKPEGADLSIVAQADFVRAFMQEVGWERGAVAGHDIGGGIAQLIALENSQAITKLVLLDTIAYDSWPVPEIDRLKDPAWDEILATRDLSPGFAKSFKRGMVHQERVDDQLVAEYVRPFEGVEGRRAYLRCARALRTEDLATAMDRVELLDIPTLIIWGEEDDFQKVEYGRRLAAAMPRARLVVLEEAGHFVLEDRPEEVARLIREFVGADG
jgi:pimeloyl-ACP methyl ester carboxylesterase